MSNRCPVHQMALKGGEDCPLCARGAPPRWTPQIVDTPEGRFIRCTPGGPLEPSPRQSIDDATAEEWDQARRELSQMNRAAMEQKPPAKENAHPAVWPLVLHDMIDRDQSGREKYGVPLKAHNGRDTLLDAYQEALDLAVYLRTAIYERDGK